MAKPKKPTALLVANGWYLDFGGLVSPHFEQLSGLSKKTGTVEIVDAGTNVKMKFSSQIVDFGAITLTRTYDGSVVDIALRTLINSSIREGIKFPIMLVKEHFGVEVFRIAMEGVRFTEENHPNLDIMSEEKYLMSYAMTVDEWTNVDTGLPIKLT